MEAIGSAATVILLIALWLGLGTWVFAGLMLVGLASLSLVLDMPLSRLGVIMQQTMWRASSTWELAAVPLFIFMGEIIFRTDISERLFRGLTPWVNAIPGRLLHANIAGCTLFAAISGSSTATTATVGKITTVALEARGYDTNLTIGSLAGAGSLGLLIPPSISMIIYGVLGEVSIARLFAAGVLPGLLVAGLYSSYIIARSMADPTVAPTATDTFGWGDRMRGLLDLTPIFALIVIILGGIYTGLATPSEAAALGLAATLVATVILRQLTMKVITDSLMGAVRISCMVISILAAAAFLSSAMGYLHVPQDIARALGGLNLTPYQLIFLIAIFYIVLGLFLDGLSILVMSMPITLPLVLASGFDPVWFGVFVVIMIELAMVTPPIGFNLFVIQGLTGHPIGRIAVAALPFFLLMCLAASIITAFPGIALWLPNVLFGANAG